MYRIIILITMLLTSVHAAEQKGRDAAEMLIMMLYADIPSFVDF